VIRSALVLLLAPLALACGTTAGFTSAQDGRVAVPVEVLSVRWRIKLTEDPLVEYKPQEFASAASDGERIFVGSSSKVLFALRPRDGAVLWKHTVGGAISSRPLASGDTGLVYFGADDGGLYALDAQSGAQRWVYRAHAPIASQPVYAGGLVYFTSGENRIYALDARSGVWKWQYDREAPESFAIRGYPSPLVSGGRVYVGFADGYLTCLQAGTGDVMWARSLAAEAPRFADVDSTPIIYRDTLYASSYASGVYALDPKDGSVRWRFDVEGATSVRARAGRLYFSAAKQGLHALDLDGHLLWRQALAEGGELSAPTLVSHYVLVSSAAAGTYIADAISGELYQYFSPGHGVTAEATTDGNQVYVLSNGGFFYALGLPPA
jgi:outer membrane protein assembly factor BamB